MQVQLVAGGGHIDDLAGRRGLLGVRSVDDVGDDRARERKASPAAGGADPMGEGRLCEELELGSLVLHGVLLDVPEGRLRAHLREMGSSEGREDGKEAEKTAEDRTVAEGRVQLWVFEALLRHPLQLSVTHQRLVHVRARPRQRTAGGVEAGPGADALLEDCFAAGELVARVVDVRRRHLEARTALLVDADVVDTRDEGSG
mmetsp:Transcript_3696/g.13052  ORF Transcript_3696/g.13052 Transcript_3696/m.13052 type:complete len:201 (+) Transcript_3696:60-662(+)